MAIAAREDPLKKKHSTARAPLHCCHTTHTHTHTTKSITVDRGYTQQGALAKKHTAGSRWTVVEEEAEGTSLFGREH